MKIYDNGTVREMTDEEIKRHNAERADLPDVDGSNALTDMVTDMSTATTLAQMRAAAKKFLLSTETTGGEQ